MRELLGTMPRRVTAMAIGLSILVLGLTALLIIFLYYDHEIDEFNSLLTQDANIIAQRFEVGDGGRIEVAQTGSNMLYDRPKSEWVWQLFTREGQAFNLIAQSKSFGEGVTEAVMLNFPRTGFDDFSAPNGVEMHGYLSKITIKTSDDPYYLGIAAPILHVNEEVQEAAELIALIFVTLAGILSLLVYWVVRRGLKPLSRLQNELSQMQEGRGMISDENWPADLEPIVGELRALDFRINALIDRHRRQTVDLAHGLKTPLAILSRITPELPEVEREKITEQTGRISTAVRRNLSRLRTGAITSSSTPVHDTVEEIVFAMEVLFRERDLDIRNKIDQKLVFRGDADDLKEIVGNLLDNACKWAESKIHIECVQEGGTLILRIGDDGPGLDGTGTAPSLAPENDFVSGVGLFIVKDIAQLYEGSVTMGASHLGGAEITVTLPAGRPLS